MFSLRPWFGSVMRGPVAAAVIAGALLLSSSARAQDPGAYTLGDQRTLEIVVSVWGEVLRPGEYRVSDTADVLQLLSKAGGPTEFAKLSGVTITHAPGATGGKARIEPVAIDVYLKRANATAPPRLEPGDVVMVPRNAFSKWKQVAGILRDLSIVASTYFLYLRTVQ